MNNLPEQIRFTFLFAIIILLMFVGFIILVVMVYKKKQAAFINEKLLQEIEHRNVILEIQKKIQEERERISHDMHDDLGAGISALKLQAEFLKQKVGEQHLKEDIDDLLKTSEEMNLSMREMLWSLNSSNDNLGNFMQYVSLYAESFFKKTHVKINITRKVELPDTKLNAEIRRNFFLCAKEALNNVYKHSKAQNVDILFMLKDHLFTMEIIDDGVGLGESLTSGNGLNNMQRRIQNLCGNYTIKPSEKGLHLVFEITL